MTYQLGAEINFKGFTGKVGIKNEGGIVGFRAFARNEKTGTYREVLGCSQEDGWVDGANEGFWFNHTHDTKDEAATLAWKAYRWLNKGRTA
jgi:hypothetical protein